MTIILTGKPVAESIDQLTADLVKKVNAEGRSVILSLVRVGSNEDDMAYEKSIVSKCDKLGVDIKRLEFPSDVSQEEIEAGITSLAEDESVSGILVFRPLPKHLDEDRILNLIPSQKDVDGCTINSLGGLFANKDIGYPPCTAEAVIKMLDYYDIDVSGKKVAIVGRSLVVGKPLGIMLMNRNATCVNCHTGTSDIPSITKAADIIIAACGRLRKINRDYIGENQVVIDVGINWDEEISRIAGDVDFDDVEEIVSSISPVPGGIGAITTTLLLFHTADSASRKNA